jgi:hypothetical protein
VVEETFETIYMGMMLVIAVVASILAFIQNSLMFAFGMKEMAITSFPLSFTGIFLLEIASIWVAYLCLRKFLRRNRELVFAGCMLLILGAAEFALPASFFSILIRQAERKYLLQRIQELGTSIEPLSSDHGGVRFALTYALQFPKTGHYLTFPASIGPEGNQVFGNYFTKVHPEYHDENYVFEAGKPYRFTVVFDTQGKTFDFSQEEAHIDICDSKDYFVACRIISIGLNGVPTAFAIPAASGKLEPEVPADNIRDITEKSIRLVDLLISETNKSGQPVAVSYEIMNAGKRDIPIPGDNFGNIISVDYGWEAISDSAKKTKVTPGTWHFGNAVAAGAARITFIRKSSLAPGERVAIHDEARPFEPLAPGEYRLHIVLFSLYATDPGKPEQDMIQAFSVQP